MFFRVNIPGVGQVFVQARDQNEAIAAAQRYVNQNGIRLEEGAGNFTATGFAAGSIPGGATVIGLDGKRVAPASSDLDTPNTAPGGGNTGTPTSGTGTPASTPAGGAGTPFDPSAQAGGPAGGAAITVDPEAVSPFGDYRNFLRSQGLDPDSILGGTLAAPATYQDFLNVHGINQILHNLGAGAQEGQGSNFEQFQQQFGRPQSFVDFFKQQGPSGIANTALGALQGIAGQAPGQENSFLSSLQSARPTDQFGEALGGAAMQALRTRLSPAVLGLFGNQALGLSNRRFEDTLASAAQGGTSAPTYVQHLLRTLGLG